MSNVAFTTADAGPAVEKQLATDLIRRGVWIAPALIAIGFLAWSIEGAASSAYGLVLVLLNFFVAATMLSTAARISLGLLMGAALFGYVLRLGLIFAAVYVVKDMAWFEAWPFGLTVIVTHLGLLFWETRYVSATLAFPALKPKGQTH